MIRHRAHLDVVAEHEPVVSEFVAQDVHHVGGQRRRTLLVELRKEHVRRHDARDPRIHGGAEGRQLDLAQAGEVEIEARQGQVAVEVRVAVSRKMLGAGGEPLALHRFDEGGSMGGDELRGAREAAIADDRVVGVAVDVDDRREVEVETAVEQLRRERAGEVSRVLDGPAAEDPHRRPLGPGRAQALDPSALLIERDDERGVLGRERVELGHDATHLLRIAHVALEQDHTADPALAHQPREIVRDLEARIPHEEQLSRMVRDRHRLTPLCAVEDRPE